MNENCNESLILFFEVLYMKGYDDIMPYKSEKEVPNYVPKKYKKKWMYIWNKVYNNAKKKKSKKEAERIAFAVANKWLQKQGESLKRKAKEIDKDVDTRPRRGLGPGGGRRDGSGLKHGGTGDQRGGLGPGRGRGLNRPPGGRGLGRGSGRGRRRS